jgi:hypothetical protein
LHFSLKRKATTLNPVYYSKRNINSKASFSLS